MKFNAPTCTKQKYSVAYGICVNYIKKPLFSLIEEYASVSITCRNMFFSMFICRNNTT